MAGVVHVGVEFLDALKADDKIRAQRHDDRPPP